MYCLQNSYDRSPLPRIMLACFSAVFPLSYDKTSLRTNSCCPLEHMKKSEHLSHGSSCPQTCAVNYRLTPKGPSLD